MSKKKKKKTEKIIGPIVDALADVHAGSVRCLGLDPGFADIGLMGIKLRPLGVQALATWLICTKPSKKKHNINADCDFDRRLEEIGRQFAAILDEFQPDVVASERRPRLRNNSANAKCAAGYAAMHAIARQRRIPWLIYEPVQIKDRVTGDKSASKADMIAAMRGMFPGFKGWPTTAKVEHVADAGGAALCAQRSQVVEVLLRARAG